MLNRVWIRTAIAFCLILLPLLSGCSPTTTATADSPYSQIAPSADGIGKVYFGREIAQVMGHQGAAWLERSSRKFEESPDVAIDLLDLRPADTVADIGSGTGYFSFRMAPLVPAGKVLAVDIQPEMLEMIAARQKETGVDNIEPVQGQIDDPGLPQSAVDLALMVDAYHEFSYPQEMMLGIVEALKPGGRVVLAEYRAENPFVAIKRLHKMSQKQVKKEMTAVGLVWQKTDDSLPQQHLMFFEKPV
ncbi:MAG: class I SAM-dependent methyltransferase [Leptolyngbyaceae cyanobacterium SL_1_1]|nr:class I SAM-dependent methyltransferase [Leptolyngbyaceae cyanobacterium RM2_2_21]NJN01399.1 class I SAM-dependent methyltransferase [Leptolyngbyaceae cyanobacterium RM1_1_2]NJO11158.1 class I SAM-dependent methyltransferase [Leptolyngbyaceae cyanobacterium SL_1_1]